MLHPGFHNRSRAHSTASAHPGVTALCAGIYADHPVFLIFLIGRTDSASHDGNHNDNPGHEERGETLCIVQGAADPHEPEGQVGTEFAVHVIEQNEIFFIKYSIDVIG
jgi:hypothetical protein